MEEARKTEPLELDENFQQLLRQLEIEDVHGTATLTMYNEVLFLIDHRVVRLIVQSEQHYTLGRFANSDDPTKVDLNPYGALQKGVSRAHAQLIMQNEKLYIIDLHSTNGTYINNVRLQPHQPALLHKGKELLLGRMRMQVVFK